MIRQDRIPDRDMTRDALVEPPVREDAERSRQVLFSVEPFLLQRRELGVLSDLELFARHGHAQGADALVAGGAVVDDGGGGGHGGDLFSGFFWVT